MHPWRHISQRVKLTLPGIVGGTAVLSLTAAVALSGLTALSGNIPQASAQVKTSAMMGLTPADPLAPPIISYDNDKSGQLTAQAAEITTAIRRAHWQQERIAARRRAEARAVILAAQPTPTPAASTPAPPPPPPAAPAGDPQQTAMGMLGSYGWSSSEFSCLQPLWNRESGWNYQAFNSGSGAFGIPQALPGSKMAAAGADWQTNPATQIKWGMGYIKSTYGTPCGAWSHEQAYGWY